MEVWPGKPYPLGSNYDGFGTNFALYSDVAERVELCLFDATGAETRVALPEVDGLIWHGYLPNVEPGQLLRLPGARPARPCQRPAVQPEQTADRPLRQGDRRPLRLAAVTFRIQLRRSGQPQRRRLRARHAEVGSDQSVLRLGNGPPAAAGLRRQRDLRGARQRTDPDPSRHPRRHSRHLFRDRAPGHHRPSEGVGRHRDRTHAGPSLRQRLGAAGHADCRTTGATTPSASSPPTASTRPAAARVGRFRSSRRWCEPSTRRASRCSSTWSTTTPPRATTSAPPCRFGVSTTPPTTVSSRTTGATTWTTPARATASMSGIRTRCN